MKEIALTKGYVTIVDDEDYERVAQYKWHAAERKTVVYASRHMRLDGKSIQVLLHRYIVGAMQDQYVDHKNCDGLDNRRDNLRICTVAQNLHNSRTRANKTSCYKGVCWSDALGKWRSTIKVDGKQINLGLYESEEHAAIAYDQEAKRHFGEFARVNFEHAPHIQLTARAKRSKYVGVTRQPGAGGRRPWLAFIRVGDNVLRIGTFSAEVDAAMARDAVAFHVFGCAAKLNFHGVPQGGDEVEDLLREFNRRAGGARLRPAPEAT